MKLKELLESKGFKDGIDFSVEGHNIAVLPQKRQIPGAPEVKDEAGNVIAPEIPPSEETFYAEIPQASELIKEILMGHEDLVALVNEYLSITPHTKDQNDSFNIQALVLGDMSAWRFKFCPAPSIEQLYDLITPAAEREQKREQKRKDDEEKKLTKKQKARKALKEVDLSKVTTIAALKAVMKEVIDLLDD